MNDNPSECNQPGAVAHKSRRAHYAILGTVCAFVIGVYAWSAKPGWLELYSYNAENTYYNLLVRGGRTGQLNLKREVPSGVAQLADPFDPKAIDPYLSLDYPLLDLSYYDGKLYLYFGVTPALLLFLPYAAMTGHYLLHKEAVVVFFSVGFLASVGLMASAWRRYVAKVGVGTAAVCTLALALTILTLATLQRCDVYEVAISCGYALTMVTLTLLWQAMNATQNRAWWLAGASFAYGLALGARPSLLFGAIILLVPVVMAWREMTQPSQGSTLRTLFVAALGPITVVGLGLLLYNYLRFDNPSEFGHYYALNWLGQNKLHPFGLRFLGFNSLVYFLEPARWSSRIPFVHDITLPALPAGQAAIQHPFGILSNIPLVWLGIATPLAWRGRLGEARCTLRWFGVTLFLLFGSCALTLGLFFATCLRYQVEFLPSLVLLALLGILGLERALAGRGVWKHATRWGWGLLLAFSVLFNVFAMVERSVESYIILGGFYDKKPQLEKAVECYQKALAWQPDNAQAHIGLGLTLSRQRKGPEAIAQLEEAIRLEPDSAEAHNGLGTVLFKLGRVKEAISRYEQALRFKPDYAEAHDNLAAALVQHGQMAEVVRHCEEALRLKPELASAQNNLGFVLFQQGQVAEAIGYYEKAVQLKPDFTDAHMNLGIALSQLGKVAEAMGHYEAVLRLKPDDAEAHSSLAGLLVQRGQLAEATRHYEAAVRLKPDVAETHNNLGVALFRQGKTAEGIAHLKEAVRLKPDFAQARDNLRAALRQ